VHDGRTQLIFLTSNQVKKGWDLLESSQVHKGVDQKVWTKKHKIIQNNHGYYYKAWEE